MGQIEKAKVQNLMIAAIQNLRKLMRYSGGKPAAGYGNGVVLVIIENILGCLARFLGFRPNLERILSF